MEKFIPYEKLSKKEKAEGRSGPAASLGVNATLPPGSRITAKPITETNPGIGSVSITKPNPGFSCLSEKPAFLAFSPFRLWRFFYCSD